MNPSIETFFDEKSCTYSYIVSDPASQSCAIIDSVLDYDHQSGRTSTRSADQMIAYIHQHDLKLEWLLETHVHADHISASHYIKSMCGGEIAIGEHIKQVQEIFSPLFNQSIGLHHFDRLLGDSESFNIGNLSVVVIHTPGHTPACMTYVIGNVAFVGDTLFMPDYGTARCDFPGGDASVLYRSIQKLFALPDHTQLFMCHDYKAPGRDVFCNKTTVYAQRTGNIQIHQGVSEDEFVAMRLARDATLKVPALIIPSVQLNIRAGELPEPASNGIRYLSIPLNTL